LDNLSREHCCHHNKHLRSLTLRENTLQHSSFIVLANAKQLDTQEWPSGRMAWSVLKWYVESFWTIFSRSLVRIRGHVDRIRFNGRHPARTCLRPSYSSPTSIQSSLSRSTLRWYDSFVLRQLRPNSQLRQPWSRLVGSFGWNRSARTNSRLEKLGHQESRFSMFEGQIPFHNHSGVSQLRWQPRSRHCQ
jgi:hypothetical protein